MTDLNQNENAAQDVNLNQNSGSFIFLNYLRRRAPGLYQQTLTQTDANGFNVLQLANQLETQIDQLQPPPEVILHDEDMPHDLNGMSGSGA